MMNIIVKEDFDYSSISGNIYCTIYIEEDNKYFPYDDWSDFPVPILNMWCETLINSNYNNEHDMFTLDFMDGSFAIYCERKKNKIYLKMSGESVGKIKSWVSIVDFKIFILEVYKVSVTLIETIKKYNFQDVTDLDKLIFTTKRLYKTFLNADNSICN